MHFSSVYILSCVVIPLLMWHVPSGGVWDTCFVLHFSIMHSVRMLGWPFPRGMGKQNRISTSSRFFARNRKDLNGTGSVCVIGKSFGLSSAEDVNAVLNYW